MAKISIAPKQANQVINAEADLAKKLKSMSSEINSIKGALRFKISCQQQIKARLNEAEAQITKESDSISALHRGLEQAVARYNQAENRNTGLLRASPTKITDTSGSNKITQLLKKLREKILDILRSLGLLPGGSNNSSSEYAGEPVNMCTGNYVNDIWELTLRGDMELSFVRHYNSQFIQSGPLGLGWSHSLDCTLKVEGDEVTVCWGDGRQERFDRDESGTFVYAFGGYNTLEQTEEGYYYTTRDGKKTFFNAGGHITQIRDRAGHGLSFIYEDDCLVRVAASEERWIQLSYNEEGLLTRLTDSMNREVSFQYDGALLRRVFSADGTSEQYEYDGNSRLSAIINAADVRILENTFDDEGRVIHQRFPDGSEMRYEYQDDHVIFTDRNGSQAVYYHDQRLRHTCTHFAVGEESYTYNDKNERITYTDLNGKVWKREFDESGNVISLTDPLGQVTRYRYNARGLLTFVSAPDGGEIRMAYDESGNMTEIVDAVGSRQTTVYQDGRVVEVVDPDGLKTVFSYDTEGRVIAVTDSLGNTVHHEYDKAGRLVKLTDKNGGVSEFEYDGMDRLLLIRNPTGQERWITYSPTGKVAEIRDFDGQTERWTFNKMDMIASYTDKAGNVITFTYDSMSNPVEIILPDGSIITRSYNQMNLLEWEDQTGMAPHTFEYDSYGRIIAEHRGEESKLYRYDAAGRLIGTTDWDGREITVERDALGRVTKRTCADGSTVTFAYDAAGRCVTERDALGREVSYDYSPAGRMTGRTDESGVRTCYTYGSDGLLSRVTYADGKYIDFTYDAMGNLVKRALQSGYTEFYAYDSLSRRIRISDNEGREKRLEYDAVGNVIRTEDGLGRVVRYSYSAVGDLEKVIDEMGQATHYGYDWAGRLSAVLKGIFPDARVQEFLSAPEQYQKPENVDCHLTTWKWDPSGSVTEIRNAVGAAETFTYDAYGRMASHTDPSGSELRYRYHPGGLMAEVECSGASLARYTYDKMKRMTGMEDQWGTASFQYDAAGQLTHTRDSFGHDVDYVLEGAGVKKEVTANGRTYLYEYDSCMRLTEVSMEGNRISYRYDGDGRLAKKEIVGGLSESYFYTPAGQVRRIVRTDEEGECYACDYQYDALGNVTEKTETHRGGERRVTVYGYDCLNRLTSVTENGTLRRSYRYDQFGNRTEMTEDSVTTQFLYNVLNQVTEKVCGDQVSTYTYDERGNLITETRDGQTRTFVYNQENRLINVKDFDGTVAEYFWDGMGHRLGKVVDGKKVLFVNDFSRPTSNVLSIDAGEETRYLFWDEALTAELSGEEVRWFFTDELGSVRAMADNTGKMVDRFDYDEFGKSTMGSYPEFGFSGLQYDAESASYFARARSYSPQLGRFLAKDKEQYIFPEIPESVNLYAYCRNNPVTFIDPEGTDCYIFYLPEWQGEAVADQKALAKKYGYDVSKVHMIPISNKQDLTNGWNGMGTVNGQQVDIDTVVIDSHASPNSLGFGNGSSMTARDIQNLNSRDVKELVLYGCNAGHMDYQNTNPAAQFAQRVNGAQVLASDGTVYSSPSGRTDYASRADNTFKRYLQNGRRDNMGWIEYRYENGQVRTHVVDDKKMYLNEMTDYLRRRRGTMC